MRWRQLYYVSKVKSTISSSPCSGSIYLLFSAVLEVEFPLKAIWDVLDDLNFGAWFTCLGRFTCVHICLAQRWTLLGPRLTRKTTITQTLSCPIYKLKRQPSFYFNFISQPCALSILVSYSQSNSQKITFSDGENVFIVINHYESEAYVSTRKHWAPIIRRSDLIKEHILSPLQGKRPPTAEY